MTVGVLLNLPISCYLASESFSLIFSVLFQVQFHFFRFFHGNKYKCVRKRQIGPLVSAQRHLFLETWWTLNKTYLKIILKELFHGEHGVFLSLQPSMFWLLTSHPEWMPWPIPVWWSPAASRRRTNFSQTCGESGTTEMATMCTTTARAKCTTISRVAPEY